MDIAFSVKVKDLRVKPKRREGIPVGFEQASHTDQLKAWFKLNDLEFDEHMEEIWEDITMVA